LFHYEGTRMCCKIYKKMYQIFPATLNKCISQI
jgi:hypothetical protein